MDLYDPDKLELVVLYLEGDTTGILANILFYYHCLAHIPKLQLTYTMLIIILDGGGFPYTFSSHFTCGFEFIFV